MSQPEIRIRIENEILGRLEKKYSEEEQANHLMSLLIEAFPLHSASILAVAPGGRGRGWRRFGRFGDGDRTADRGRMANR